MWVEDLAKLQPVNAHIASVAANYAKDIASTFAIIVNFLGIF